MPVDEDQASGDWTAPITQTGVVAFTTTHWSIVLAARGPSPAAEAALEKLCRTYTAYGIHRFIGQPGYNIGTMTVLPMQPMT